MRIAVKNAQIKGQKKKHKGDKPDPDEHVVAF
jgi:hypothetical protein